MLLEKLEVDPIQWQALVRAGLRRDLRSSRFLSGTHQRIRNPVFGLFLFALFTLFLGASYAVLALEAVSLLLAALFDFAGVMFLAASLIIVEYFSIVLAPDDFDRLGHLPVASRTYFFAKLTNLLIYILGFSLLGALPAAIGFGLRAPASPWRGLAALFSLMTAAFTTAMAMVLLYQLLLKLVPKRQLRYLISAVQVLASFTIYAGYILFPQIFPEKWLQLNWIPTKWHLLLPPAWFVGLFNTLIGNFDQWTLTATLIGLGTLIIVSTLGLGRLARDYLTNISGQAGQNVESAVSGAPAHRRFAELFRRPEERIVALLISAQFRTDTKFRLAILTIFPLIFVYLGLSVKEGTLPDPFVDTESWFKEGGLIYLALLLIPLLVKQSIEVSDAYESAWVFYASPIAIDRLVLAVKRVTYLTFVIPALLIMLGLFMYFYENVTHAILHTLTLGLIAYLMQQILFLSAPRLPFSEPRVRGQQSGWLMRIFILVPLLAFFLLNGISQWIYPFSDRLILFYLSSLFAILITERLVRKRVRAKFGG